MMIKEIKKYKDLIDEMNFLSSSSQQSPIEDYKGKDFLGFKSLNSNNLSFLNDLLKGNFLKPSVLWKIGRFAFRQIRRRPRTVLKVAKIGLYVFLFVKSNSLWKFLKNK